MQPERAAPMSLHDNIHAGGADAVGLLDRLPPGERMVVTALRRWNSGDDARAGVWNDFAAALGTDSGRQALRAFEALLATLALGADRPLWHHGAGCPCIGRDEAAIAATVTAAGRGDIDRARLHAGRITRAEAVPAVVAAAAVLGESLAHAGAEAREGSARRTRCFPGLH